MNELPDGSGCFTATVMSEEEAMALPLKERPLCYRLSSDIYHAVFEAIGAASMCWTHYMPDEQVFDSTKAEKIAVDLCFKIAEEIEKINKNIDHVRDQLNIQGSNGNWNYDPYMMGLYNGLECALATLENREAVYRKTPKVWLRDLPSILNMLPTTESESQ